MKEFEKWYNYVESEGNLWPSFGRYDTAVELIAAKEAWIAALKWALLTGSWETVAQEIKEEIYKTDGKT